MFHVSNPRLFESLLLLQMNPTYDITCINKSQQSHAINIGDCDFSNFRILELRPDQSFKEKSIYILVEPNDYDLEYKNFNSELYPGNVMGSLLLVNGVKNVLREGFEDLYEMKMKLDLSGATYNDDVFVINEYGCRFLKHR